MKRHSPKPLPFEDQQTITMPGKPDVWASLIAETSLPVGRPTPDALTYTELGRRLELTENGARLWAERQRVAGRVKIVEGRHVKTHKPTFYVVPLGNNGQHSGQYAKAS